MKAYWEETNDRLEEEARAKALRKKLAGRMMPPVADIIRAQSKKWRWWHGTELLPGREPNRTH